MAILESGLLPLGRIYLERRPSSPGLDHGLCVYSKLGNLAAVGSLLFETAETAFCSSHTKKMSTVFASFSRCSHRFSPAWTTRARLKGYTHTSTLGHMTTPLYAAHQRGTSSLKTAVLSQHSSPMLLKSRCWQVLRQRICYHLVGCYNCARVFVQMHRPKLRESKLTHNYAQVQKLFTSLTGVTLPRVWREAEMVGR